LQTSRTNIRVNSITLSYLLVWIEIDMHIGIGSIIQLYLKLFYSIFYDGCYIYIYYEVQFYGQPQYLSLFLWILINTFLKYNNIVVFVTLIWYIIKNKKYLLIVNKNFVHHLILGLF